MTSPRRRSGREHLRAIAWATIIEVGLLEAVTPSVAKWLPTSANIALSYTSASPSKLLSPALAAVVLALWAAVLAGVGLVLERHRDV